jgi:hypothetical protein
MYRYYLAKIRPLHLHTWWGYDTNDYSGIKLLWDCNTPEIAPRIQEVFGTKRDPIYANHVRVLDSPFVYFTDRSSVFHDWICAFSGARNSFGVERSVGENDTLAYPRGFAQWWLDTLGEEFPHYDISKWILPDEIYKTQPHKEFRADRWVDIWCYDDRLYKQDAIMEKVVAIREYEYFLELIEDRLKAGVQVKAISYKEEHYVPDKSANVWKTKLSELKKPLYSNDTIHRDVVCQSYSGLYVIEIVND